MTSAPCYRYWRPLPSLPPPPLLLQPVPRGCFFMTSSFTFFLGMSLPACLVEKKCHFVSPKSRSFPIPPAVWTGSESFRVCAWIVLSFFCKKNNTLQGMRMRTFSLSLPPPPSPLFPTCTPTPKLHEPKKYSFFLSCHLADPYASPPTPSPPHTPTSPCLPPRSLPTHNRI